MALRRMALKNTASTLLLVSIISIPMFTKNYGLPLLEFELKPFLIYYGIPTALSAAWFTYIGHEAKQITDLEESSPQSTIMMTLIIIMTLGVLI